MKQWREGWIKRSRNSDSIAKDDTHRNLWNDYVKQGKVLTQEICQRDANFVCVVPYSAVEHQVG